jgi:integrase
MDPATVTVLRTLRKHRGGGLALQLVRDDALVFGDIEGQHRNPEHTSRAFARDQARCREALGADALPVIRLHDLRHTHATILEGRGVARTVYSHVLPGSQRDAANLFARLVREASGR